MNSNRKLIVDFTEVKYDLFFRFINDEAFVLMPILTHTEMEKGSSSRAGGSGDAFKGLQFGRKIYFEDASNGDCSSIPVAAPALPEMRQLVAGKKAKGAAQGCGQPLPPPRCQVEGCNLDLKGAKSYYCRHKVCGMHSKSSKVIVAGLEQRFCQQCSRFHLLKEFDLGKRSCRRRLAGHNERRRKPPPGLLPSRYGSEYLNFVRPEDNSGHRGFLMDFMHPRPPDATKNTWPTMRSGDRVVTNQLQGRSIQSPGGVMSNALPALFSASELALGECITGVSDSTCALSLLSTQPWDAPTVPAMPRNQRDPLISPSTGFEMAQTNIASSCLNSSWAFKDHVVGSSSSHEMGLRQIQDAGNCQFSGELELAPQGNRHCPDDVSPSEVYDHLHDLHWPL